MGVGRGQVTLTRGLKCFASPCPKDSNILKYIERKGLSQGWLVDD